MPDHDSPRCACCTLPATTCRRYQTWRAWVTISYCAGHAPRLSVTLPA